MTASQELFDASVRRRIALLRLQSSIAEKLVAGPLRSSDRRLIAGLAAMLATAQLSSGSIIGAATAPKIGRLAGIERFLNENASALQAAVLVALIPSLIEIAQSEADVQVAAINAALLLATASATLSEDAEGPQAVTPPADVVAAIVETHPIAGDLLKSMVAGFVLNRAFKVMQRTRRGVAEGETVETIVSAVAGTKARAFRDGVLESGRQGARILVNQSAEGTAAAAREMVFRRNVRLFQGVVWISVLDGRTSPICRVRSGMIFPVGVGPRPPAHIHCRSVVSAVFKGDDIPPHTSYNDWLKRQPAAFQDEVLGPSRGALFRSGSVTLDRFVDVDTGHQWTLDELRRRMPDAFAKQAVA